MNNLNIICSNCSRKFQQYWQEKYSKENLSNSEVKVKFTNPEGQTEHMWVQLDSDTGEENLLGILDNDPVFNQHLFAGDVISFKRSDIEQHYNTNFSFKESQLEKMIVMDSFHKQEQKEIFNIEPINELEYE